MNPPYAVDPEEYILKPPCTTRYTSKFANKVRTEMKKQKTCWSSMGLPSSAAQAQAPAPAPAPSTTRITSGPKSRQRCLLPPDFCSKPDLFFGDKRVPAITLRTKQSSHTNLPHEPPGRILKLIPCPPPPPTKPSKWYSYYKLKPTLVRNRANRQEFEDIDKSCIYDLGDEENSGKYEDHGHHGGAGDIKSILPPPGSPDSTEKASSNPKDLEKTLCSCHSAFENVEMNKRMTRCSVPNLLNPCLCSKAYDMVHTYPEAVDLKTCEDPQELKHKLARITSDKDLCDAFILQKLIDIRARMENGNGPADPNASPGNVPEVGAGDKVYVNDSGGDDLPSTCYNGDVNYIDRGEKDFILENALKCSRTPAKGGPSKVVDDFKGNTRDLTNSRMVFKKDYGQIPDYISRRKQEIQQEKDLLFRFETEEANRNCRPVSDEERQKIIEGLSKNWETLFREYQSLPLFSSSQRVLKRKSQIETQLRDLESDLRLISRHGRLFVSTNSPSPQFLWK